MNDKETAIKNAVIKAGKLNEQEIESMTVTEVTRHGILFYKIETKMKNHNEVYRDWVDYKTLEVL